MMKLVPVLLLLLVLLNACGNRNSAPAGLSPAATELAERQQLRLITLPAIAESGVLTAVLPTFEAQQHARVEVMAVNLDEALVLGEDSIADLLLLPASARVEEFVRAGHGSIWQPVLFGDLVLVGPAVDPAGIRGMPSAAEACKAIADTRSPFLVPGNGSYLFPRVEAIWEQLGHAPTPEMAWYQVADTNASATLLAANAQSAYTLTWRASYLVHQDALPDLTVLVGGESISANPDPTLRMPYGVIPITPERHPEARPALAEAFTNWLTSAETQAQIAEFGREHFGHPVFVPR
jgi:tungstate transport system substrate-binding protein